MGQMEKRERSEKAPGHTYWQWILAILVSMTSLNYGLDVGWISPMTEILQSDHSPAGEPLSDTTLSWIASNLCLGAVFTVPVYSYISDRFGTKASVIAITIPQAISWIARLCFASGSSLIVSRIFSGFAAGGCFSATVMYVKEISQDSIRGILASLLILFQNSAIFVMYIMGIYLDYYTILWAVTGLPIATGILLCLAPESPAYLIKRGKTEEAIRTVAFLRGLEKDHKIVLSEIAQMKNENDYFKSQPNMSLREIVKNPIWRRGIIVSMVIISVQAMNGAFAITTYASAILMSAGVQFSIGPHVVALSIPALLTVGSTVSTLGIDRIGRKTLNITMLAVSVCSMLCIAVCMLMKDYGATVPSWLPVTAMMVSVSTYAAGISPLPFVIMAEMFNFQIRAKVFGLVVTLAWFMTFLPVVGFMPLSNALGLHTCFFVFAGINLFGVLFTLVFLPETRGKSADQIEKDIAVRLGLEKRDKNVT